MILMTQDRSLADLGNWPATRIRRDAHRIIRHAYEEVLTACARLISFSTGGPSIGDGPIDERQEMLAIEDLISFAIHARRLIENTGQQARFNKTEIVFPGRSKLQRLRIWKIINGIIHNRKVEIIRDIWSREALFRNRLEVVLANIPNENFPPMVIVTSEKGIMVFPVRELIETFQEKILSPVIDLCAEHHLFLEDLDF
jgi:hypothetical protein